MISVCLASYNGEKYIKEQVDSILKQLEGSDEIVISDDGSTDNTLGIINSYNDARIRVIYNSKEDKGYSRNFENAIRNAKGDYIFLSDQDDVWHDDKVKLTMVHLQTHDLVVSDAAFVSETLEDLNYTHFDIRGGRSGFLASIYKAQYLGACMAFRREILPKLLPFPKDAKLCPHDIWIALVSTFFFKTYVIKKILIKYRRHGKNASTGGLNSEFSLMDKVYFRLYALGQIFSRMLRKE